MQRILSVETSRNNSAEREFVTKRLCYSILFSVAFLFLLAGKFSACLASQVVIRFELYHSLAATRHSQWKRGILESFILEFGQVIADIILDALYGNLQLCANSNLLLFLSTPFDPNPNRGKFDRRYFCEWSFFTMG